MPEVVNLVFFKIVRSKTKFWQMVGRGTRLAPDLFGPGEDKSEFVIFDFCQNLEFFKENQDMSDAAGALPIGQRLFVTRVELIDALSQVDTTHEALIADIKTRLLEEVSAMPMENFIVRAKRRSVERFQNPDEWENLDLDARLALTDDVAGLPSAYDDGSLPAKQFDLLIFNAQLQLLKKAAGFAKLQKRIEQFASNLEALANVPMVAHELELILEIQTESFWEDITVEMLDAVRRKLRGLVELIQPKERRDIITNFTDEIGAGGVLDMPDIGSGVDKAKFKMKVRRFLEQQRDHITLMKVKRGEALTKQDLSELERFLVENGVADETSLNDLAEEGGLGRFLRSLTGLDRGAAKKAFSAFVAQHELTADQTEFLDLVIDSLTESGFVEPQVFYESPYTDIDDMGIAGVFDRVQTQEIIKIVRALNNAVAA